MMPLVASLQAPVATLGHVRLGNLILEWKVLEDISDAQDCCTWRFSSFATQLLASLGVLILKWEFVQVSWGCLLKYRF